MTFLRSLTMNVVIVVAAAVAAGTARAEEPKDAELTEATYATWRDHVLPRKWELNYQRIAWRETERDHLPPIRDVPDEVETLKLDQIEVKSHVGGLVKSFERKAA